MLSFTSGRGETEGDREENVQKRQSFFKCSGAITEYNTLRNKWHDKESRQTHSPSSTIIWMTATGTTIIVTRGLEQIICDKNRGERGQAKEPKQKREMKPMPFNHFLPKYTKIPQK